MQRFAIASGREERQIMMFRQASAAENSAPFSTRTAEVVVITGASAGVGRATVRRFASTGAKLGLIARGRDGLDAACHEVERAGGEAMVCPLDVARADDVERPRLTSRLALAR